jgi:hypothetical protein
MDFSTIVIIGVVLFAVIGVVRSIAKSNRARRAKEESGQTGQTEQPPQSSRQSAMSDIQRAFSMMSELADEAQKAANPSQQPPSQQPPVQQATVFPAQQRPVYAQGSLSQPGDLTQQYSGNASEGLHGLSEINAQVHEGIAGLSDGIEFHGDDAHAMPSPYTSINLESVTVDISEDDFGNAIGDMQQQSKPKFKLFENQSDYMKAIIFSEILPKRNR